MINAIIRLTDELKIKNVSQLPGGVWQLKIGKWEIAINGNSHDIDVHPAGSVHATIPPFNFAIWFNGWLAGLIHPVEGGIFAAGTGANEKNFISDIDNFIAGNRASQQSINPTPKTVRPYNKG